jgi:hypothetical protein
MGITEYFCRPDHFWILSKYGHILGKTLCSGPSRQPGRQAHGGTALAPRYHVRCPWDFLGLINTSRTSLAKQRALLGISLAVSQAFLEVSDLRAQFLASYLNALVHSYNTSSVHRCTRKSNLVYTAVSILVHRCSLLVAQRGSRN